MRRRERSRREQQGSECLSASIAAASPCSPSVVSPAIAVAAFVSGAQRQPGMVVRVTIVFIVSHSHLRAANCKRRCLSHVPTRMVCIFSVLQHPVAIGRASSVPVRDAGRASCDSYAGKDDRAIGTLLACMADVSNECGITVIVNGRSGKAANPQTVEDLQRLFSGAHRTVRVECVANPLDIGVRAREAAARGDVIVGGGGDGTLSTIAAVAVEAGATLGVLPLGTLNHFAKDLGMPLDLEQAAAAIVAGVRRTVDVGEVNGRIFINNSSVGLYPRLVWEREAERQRGRHKWTAFGIAVVRTWRRYRMVVAHLQVDGRDRVVRTPFVFVGNNQYKAEGFELGGRTTLDAGHLSIFLAPECGQFEFLALPIRALTKRLSSGAPFASFNADTLIVDVPYPRVSVALDGEIALMRSPLKYRVRPGALRILGPAHAAPHPSR
jgi:diacylglycerol kinase family enzyme